MLGAENVWTWLVAHVQALLPEDWRSTAGELFRETMHSASRFAGSNGLKPDQLLEEGIDLGRRKLTGVATKEHAEAEKNYAEAARAFTDQEDKRIETELNRRTFASQIQKREAEARRATADAELAEIQVAKARLELFKEAANIDLLENLENIGIQLHWDGKGKLTFFPKSNEPAILPPTLNQSKSERPDG